MQTFSRQDLESLAQQFPDRRKAELARVGRFFQSAGDNKIRLGVSYLANWAAGDERAERTVLPLLIGYLDYSDPDVRESAEFAFSKFGPWAFGELLRRIEADGRPDSALRVTMIRALGHFVAEDDDDDQGLSILRTAFVPLRKYLEHSDPELRGAAARTLARLGYDNKTFVPRVSEMCRSPHDSERRGAYEALAHFAENSPKLKPKLAPLFLLALGDPDETIKEKMGWALASYGRPMLTPLLEKLESTEASVRAASLNALHHFDNLGSSDKIQLRTRLFSSLDDSESSVRIAAAYCIDKFCDNDDDLDSDVVEKSLWQRVARLAGRLITSKTDSMHPPSEASEKLVTRAEVVGRLCRMSISELADERIAALHSLWCILRYYGPRDDSSPAESWVSEVLGPAILQNLDHSANEARKRAFSLISQVNLPAERRRDALLAGLQDSSEEVVGSACHALFELAESGQDVAWAVPSLQKLLARCLSEPCRSENSYSHPDPFKESCKIVRQLPPNVVESLADTLRVGLECESEFRFVEVALTLSHLDRHVPSCLSRLKQLLDAGNLHPESFCDVVGKFGPKAACLASDLIRIATSPDWDCKWAAADALGNIASQDPACLKELVTLLAHPSPIVRNAAKESLAHIGDPSHPFLEPLLRSPNASLREAAQELLDR